MYWNGLMTGTQTIQVIHKLILKDQQQAPTAFIVAAVGAAMRLAVVWLAVTTLRPAVAAAT
jgi:hypothetical protein